jgi:hypothetical protein
VIISFGFKVTFGSARASRYQKSDLYGDFCIKGTVSRDFLLLVLFINQFPKSLTPAPVENLPPMSLTPVANLPPVSTTQGELVAKFAAGVVDTGGKFAAGVLDTGTGGKFATSVVDTGGAP